MDATRADAQNPPPHKEPSPGMAAVARGDERARLARQGGIREVVFGVQDGLLTTLGLVTGIASATSGGRTTILLAGVVVALTGMVSMGTGAYLGGTSERDLKAAAIRKERLELSTDPEEEHGEMAAILHRSGVPVAQAHELARALAAYPKLWEETHIEKELGIPSQLPDAPVADGVRMGATFLLGAIPPIVPYALLTGTAAFATSLAVSAVVLAALGIVKGRITSTGLARSGAQVLAVGAAAAATGYVLGVILPRLLGLHIPPGAL
ncbi:MAG TPA: VIT1/CCC1 transporter family protein [Candidatus Micrarchaeia archaeon]|nr:VIT1/CCC1 transporter family protein [Candidatus Micrarchaeia archaeon]